MKTLAEIRREIDAVDAALAPLLVRRLRLAEEVADAKREKGLAVFDPVREKSILDAVACHVEPKFAESVRDLYVSLFASSKSRQASRLSEVASQDAQKPFVAVAVVGLGLIGGSFLKAATAAGYRAIGLHHGERDGLSEADLVFVCLPPDAIVPWIRDHASEFRDGATVVDICGVKRPIVDAVSRMPKGNWTFVGGHPMAGREVSGFDNSTWDLFRGASMILTPTDGVSEGIIASLRTFFHDVGFHETVVTTPEKHDELIAFTSQLCHVIATSYVRDGLVRKSLGFTAGSYANMTRIATQDAAIWRELYTKNRDALLPVLDGFASRFAALREAIAAGDASGVERIISEGTAAKRQELLDRQRGDESV